MIGLSSLIYSIVGFSSGIIGRESDKVTKKFEIEVVWNEYIFTKYKDQVNIDVEKLKDKVRKNGNGDH